MKTEEKDTKSIEVHEAQVVSVLDNLKTSNLPEIIGWKEKQEKLVEDNPYLEIIDNKTYEDACKRRTALLKGRTALKDQDTKIASKLASFRKEVGSETAALIAITQPHEEKQDAEVKRWEGIKAAEKKAKEEAEANRVKAIQDKLESIETESYKIIQSMVFSEIESKTTEVNSICSPEFDFEEYDVMLDQVVSRVEAALESKVNTLTTNENQRLENIRLEEENRIAKEKSELQAKRLNEIMPYVAFGETLDLTKLSELEEDVFQGHLSSKKGLFEADAKLKKEAEEERLAKEEEEKDAVFEIRSKRLIEIGMIDSDEHDTFWTKLNEEYILLKSDIRNETTLEFEDTLVEAKDVIKKGLENEKQLMYNSRKSFFEKAGLVINEETQIYFPKSNLYVTLEALYGEIDNDRFESLLNEFIVWQKELDEKLAKEEAAKMKAENKARIKKYAKDKKVLTEFVESLDFRNAVPELENEDLQVVVSEFMEVVAKWKAESVELITKY